VHVASSYIPTKQEAQATWGSNFSTLITATPALYGLSAADASIIATATSAFTTALNTALDPSTKTSVTVAAKDTARANWLTVVRPYAQQIAGSPGVTPDDKIALGLNPRTSTPTPIPAPSTSPLLTFIAATPGQHTLRAADQNTPDTRGKPAGVTQLQLYRFIGTTTPTGPGDADFYGVFTKQPMAVNFVSGDNGKNCWYWARWQTRTGLVGPWSTTIMQVVIAP